MERPISQVLLCQGAIPDHQQVLRITVLGRLGEVERAGDDRNAVNNHHFIVGNSVRGIDQGLDTGTAEEVGRGVICRPLALIQYYPDLHPSPMGHGERLSDGIGGEAVGLDQDVGPGLVEFGNDRLSTAALGTEIDLPRRVGGVGVH